MSKNAWVTLTTNDSYALGALVLAYSLRRQGTIHKLAVLVTPGVSSDMCNRLRNVYDLVQEVNILDSEDAANLALLARPELGITFTKLHCWRLVQYEKCVFLDSDTLVLQNCDELFEREEFSAAPDVSWPDCFNSGVFVYRPNLDTYAKITEFALKHGSFDGGDQGLLNLYFSDWAHTDITKHLPFIYNVTAYASYCYLPAFKQFRDKIKILHFAGKLKPWLVNFNSESKTAMAPTDYAHAADLIQLWWNIFCQDVHQNLTATMSYWPAILNWSYPSQAHCGYFEMQQNYHYTQNQTQIMNTNQNENIYQNNDKRAHSAYDEVREYHDPWEDYYHQLEAQQNQINTVENWQGNVDENNHNKNNYSDNKYENKPLSPPPTLPPTPPPAARGFDEYIVEEEEEEEVVVLESPASVNVDNISTHTHVEKNTESGNNDNVNIHEEVITNQHVHDTSVIERTVHDECLETTNTKTISIDTNEHLLIDTDTDIHISIDIDSNVNEESGLAGALSQLRLGEARTPEQEAYEQVMRRQAWEQGEIDYTGIDSFDNIWKRITKTLESKPTTTKTVQKDDDPAAPDLITSADIEDGKIEYDPVTKAKIQYRVIEGGYEVVTTTPQPNGTVKTQTRTFWDPKPVSAEELLKEQENKRLVKKRFGKEIRIDSKTTMLTREIEGGYEEVYTVTNEDGTKSVKVKTFYDSVPEGQGFPNAPNAVNNNKVSLQDKRKQQLTTRNSSVDSTDSTESRQITQRKNVMQSVHEGKNTQTAQYQEESTFKETRRMSQNVEFTQNSRTVRKNSTQEQSIQAITSGSVDNKDSKKKKKTKSSIPPPPPDFIENDTTEVSKKRVPGGVEYTYTTQLESGKTITTSKTIYEEEETELTEEEIREYKKTLKDAEKHKNITSTKKLRSPSGTKQVVPSENPGDVTTVETIRIEGGTEYHYTTVTSEGIVKKAVKTVYDPVPVNKNASETEEEEIVEDYEEEIIEPGEKNIRTIESIKKLPNQFHEEVTITKEKKEKKVKRSMVISN